MSVNETVGDAAAMRDALEAARSFVVNLEIEPFSHLDEVASELLARIDAALAKPPRNCDVGTAEEQAKRLREFCKKHRDGVRRCSRCPVERIFPKDCTLAWTQLPYEEGGAR